MQTITNYFHFTSIDIFIFYSYSRVLQAFSAAMNQNYMKCSSERQMKYCYKYALHGLVAERPLIPICYSTLALA